MSGLSLLVLFSVDIKSLSVSVSLRWEEEYTMRVDLQQKMADLQEVASCQPVCVCVLMVGRCGCRPNDAVCRKNKVLTSILTKTTTISCWV